MPDNAAEDSVSMLPTLLSGGEPKTTGPGRAVVHQSSTGDLAIRDGDWKLVFLKGQAKELYNIASDLSEKTDVASGNPEIVERLTARMQQFIDQGRSTDGAAQKNDVNMSLTAPKSKNKKKKAIQQILSKRLRTEPDI